MAWLMIEGYIDPVSLRRLQENKIPITTLAVARPRELQGIAFPGEEKKYRLGFFVIDILNGTQISVRNIQNFGFDKHYDHPQIKDGQWVIPINLRIPLVKLLMGMEFAEIVQIILNYLRSYNPEQSYIPLEKNWKGEAL